MSVSGAPPMLVAATQEQHDGGLRIRVSGSVPDDRVGRFRELVDAALHAGPGPLVIDLAALTGWGHEAQAALLDLLRTHRDAGRVVAVEGLRGRPAEEAEESGLGHLLSGAAAADGPPSPRSAPEAPVSPAQASTLARIGSDRRSRRPTIHATCQYGHPAAPGGDQCDQGHVMLPL